MGSRNSATILQLHSNLSTQWAKLFLQGGLCWLEASPAAHGQQLSFLGTAIGKVGSVVQALRPIPLDVTIACDIAEIRNPIFLLFTNFISFFILVTFFCVTSHVLFHLQKQVSEKPDKHSSCTSSRDGWATGRPSTCCLSHSPSVLLCPLSFYRTIGNRFSLPLWFQPHCNLISDPDTH